MRYKVSRKYENLSISYLETKGSINPIEPIFDIEIYQNSLNYIHLSPTMTEIFGKKSAMASVSWVLNSYDLILKIFRHKGTVCVNFYPDIFISV